MTKIAVDITRFVNSEQPGWVEFNLLDAFGKTHTFIEKVPVLTTQDLNEKSIFPVSTVITCETIKKWTDENGRHLLQINTENPWNLESTTGDTKFIVEASKVVDE